VRVGIAILLVIFSSVASGQAQLVIQFEIQPQPLGEALRSLVGQVNANIIYDPSLVTGQAAKGFVMKSTLDEALTRVLRGTGLRHQYVNEKTVTLVKTGADLKKTSDRFEESRRVSGGAGRARNARN
jgi:hypothetical protein